MHIRDWTPQQNRATPDRIALIESDEQTRRSVAGLLFDVGNQVPDAGDPHWVSGVNHDLQSSLLSIAEQLAATMPFSLTSDVAASPDASYHLTVSIDPANKSHYNIHLTTPAFPAISPITVSDNATNTAPNILTLYHATTNTPALDFGETLFFKSDAQGGTNKDAGSISVQWINPSYPSQTSKMALSVFNAATKVDVLILDNLGQVTVKSKIVLTAGGPKFRLQAGVVELISNAESNYADFKALNLTAASSVLGGSVSSTTTLGFSGGVFRQSGGQNQLVNPAQNAWVGLEMDHIRLHGDPGAGVAADLTLTNNVSGTPASTTAPTKWMKVWDGVTVRYVPLYT